MALIAQFAVLSFQLDHDDFSFLINSIMRNVASLEWYRVARSLPKLLVLNTHCSCRITYISDKKNSKYYTITTAQEHSLQLITRLQFQWQQRLSTVTEYFYRCFCCCIQEKILQLGNNEKVFYLTMQKKHYPTVLFF